MQRKAILKTVDTRVQLEKIQDERDRLAEFAKYIMEKIWDRDDLECWDLQTKALELELIIESEVTEEDNQDWVEPDQPWYRYQPWLEEIEPVTGTY